MKRRLVIYFHFDPDGRIDFTCRYAVQAMLEVAQVVLFVTNGTLCPEDKNWILQSGAQLKERENVGYDVGAYRDVLLALGSQGLSLYDEVVLMNYTLAGPVCDPAVLFETMEQKESLDFWGMTRHGAMQSRRFQTDYGYVPEHLQSHFLVVRSTLFRSQDFWDYWQTMKTPKTYEESIRFHEARFTKHFSDLGFAWGSYIDAPRLAQVFVNPLMACPRVLLEKYQCPFFKRRSFFTPYADELKRTDGSAAYELYQYLRTKTTYPVDALVKELLRTQPITMMYQNLHWRYSVSTFCDMKSANSPVKQIGFTGENNLCSELLPESIYVLFMPERTGVVQWYLEKTMSETFILQAAELLRSHPEIGLLGSALPAYPEALREKVALWQQVQPQLRDLCDQYHITVPVDWTQPLPLPNGGFLLLRGSAFSNGLPDLSEEASWWLLPLLAQQAGFTIATVEDELSLTVRGEILEQQLLEVQSLQGSARGVMRNIKRRFFKK